MTTRPRLIVVIALLLAVPTGTAFCRPNNQRPSPRRRRADCQLDGHLMASKRWSTEAARADKNEW